MTIQEYARAVARAALRWCARLPDGSGAAVVSFPLPDNHWLTAEHENVPPMPFRMGTDDPRRTEWKNAIRDAGKYAVRCATMNGADNDFDPDALVQNLVVGMIGYFTPDGFSSDAWANPEQPTPAILTDTDAAVARERDRVIGIFVGELQKLHENTVLDCGDNSCLFATRRGGMRTNGGCRCIERLLDAAVAAEREECAKECERIVSGIGSATAAFPVRVCASQIRARSAKGVS